MRIKIFFKRLISISVAVVLAVTLVGCFDLGDFRDEEDYYASIGDVELVYQNPNEIEKDIEQSEYSIRDYFYNKNTGEDFTYGDPKDDESDEGKDIPQLPYVYMVIPLNRDLCVESVALYFNALRTCSLGILVYVVDNLPDDGDFTNIMLLGDPEYRQKLDDDGNPMTDENNMPILELIKYSDPDDRSIVASTTTYVENGEWVSMVLDKWNGEKNIEIKESQYLLLRFINNSGLNTGDNLSVAFRVTNLLIRAVS